MVTYLFTPRTATGERLTMQLSPEDAAKVGHRAWWRATVTDQATGRVHRVRAAACNLPGCMCDAAVVDEVHPARDGGVV